MTSLVRSARAVGGAGLVLLAVSPGFADVKLVQTVTVKSSGAQAGGRGPQTANTTSYYKGNKIRTEAPQAVIIMDGDSKQTITLNTAQKTYQVSPLGAMPQNPFMDMMQFDTKMSITPSGQTKTIAGKTAKGYNYTATIKMGMSAKGQQMAKQQGGSPQNMAALFPTFRISGQTWATDAIQVPPIAARAAVLTLSAIPGMQDFARKMESIKGLPLESTANVVVSGGAMTSRNGGQPMQISTRTVTTQISQNPLPASLFAVPAGYRKVAAPAMPGMGAMGGAMGRPGAGRAPMNR